VMRYPLPEDTADVLTQSVSQNRNLGLALDRFLPINDKLDPEGNPWKNPEDQWKITDGAKRRQRAPLGLGVPIPTLISRVNIRRAAMFKGLSGYTVLTLNAAPDYRLVAGFGAEHVLETNLCLHRIYGFPIIPGSAVKGVTRAWVFWELAKALDVPDVSAEERVRREKAKRKIPLQLLDQLLSEGEKTQEKALERLQQDELCQNIEKVKSLTLDQWRALVRDFYTIFGTTEEKGRVIFFDAYPTDAGRLKLEPDILNPHYSDYYQKKTDKQGKPIPPADYLSPVPTYFLTVAKGSPFQFVVASKNLDLAAKAKEWLTCALKELGVGGKTAAGYGFMEVR
jgi:CRISPR-associated protein Cmr6